MTSRRRVTFIVLFLVGLALRIYMISYPGGQDLVAFSSWGKAVRDLGLARAFHGTYFPLQYQLFALCSAISASFHLPDDSVLKALNLVFDVGVVLVLATLITQLGGNPAYVLVYWLHPWFITLFSQGYVDSQITFCILSMLTILKDGETFRRQVLAGIPFGLALLLKPQSAILCLAFPLYIFLTIRNTRSFRSIGLLIAPAMLLVAYNIYFTLVFYPQKHWKAFFVMPNIYLDVTNVMPVLTAHMLNVWYPLAFALKQPRQVIYRVSSTIHILPGIEARWIATAACLGLIGWFVWRVAKAGLRPNNRTYLLITCFATTTVPFVMTSAHENHLFLPSVLFIPFLAILRQPLFSWAVQLTMLLQALNLYLIYGFSQLAERLRLWYPDGVRALFSVVAVILIIIVARQLFLLIRPEEKAAAIASAA